MVEAVNMLLHSPTAATAAAAEKMDGTLEKFAKFTELVKSINDGEEGKK
jgi:hypothetical protein